MLKMTSMKVGGVILTGFGAWILINKGLNLISQVSRDTKEAAQWKAYYKYGTKDSMPPGYSATTKTTMSDGKTTEETVSDGKSHVAVNTSGEAVEAVEAAVKKSIDSLFKRENEPREAKEGQETAHEDGRSSDTYVDADAEKRSLLWQAVEEKENE